MIGKNAHAEPGINSSRCCMPLARSLRLGSGSSGGGSSRCGARRREKPAQTGGAGVDARRRPRAPKFTEIKEAEIVNKRSIILRGRSPSVLLKGERALTACVASRERVSSRCRPARCCWQHGKLKNRLGRRRS